MSETAKEGPRCVALIGPYASGKTSLLESLLYVSGAINRKGKPQDGNSVGDASPEARERGSGTEIAVADADYLGDHWSFIDCPGAQELEQEALAALMVADAAVLVCEPDLDRAPAIAPLLRFLDDRGIPHLVFINKIDTLGTRLRDFFAALQAQSRRPLLLREIPIREGDAVTGYVDLVSERAYHYSDGKPSDLIPLPEAMQRSESEARQEMLEALADFDDHLLEELLEDTTPDKTEIYENLTRDFSQDLIVPVFFGSAEHDNGVRRLLKALRHEVPNAQRTARRLGLPEGEGVLAQVFRLSHQPHVGKLAFARLWRGTLRDGMTLNGERLGGLYRLHGAGQEKVAELSAGSLAALGRLDQTRPGGFLSDNGEAAQIEALVDWPQAAAPVYALAIQTENRSDEVKLSAALAKLLEEDPALSLEHPSACGEMVLRGQGDIHLQIALARLRNRFGITVTAKQPQVPYQETIRHGTFKHSRFKRQTGGHGQFADIKVDIAPRGRGEGFLFQEEIVGGAVPKQFIPAVEEGVREALVKGPLGFPVVDVMVTLKDGQFHAVDSSELAFKTAGRQAVADSLAECGPVLLEPILKVCVVTPTEYTSKIQRVISTRRGQILGFDAREGWGGWDEIQAYMPQSDIQDMIIELRSLSYGLATFTAEFDHLEELVGKQADKVVRDHAEGNGNG